MVNDSSNTGGGRGARERLVAAAARLFYRDGINATGVEAVIQQANVSKRTLYQHFSGKAELVEDYLRALDRTGTPLERALDRADLPPRERLLAIFDAPPVDRFRGCPFHNAAVESAGTWPAVDDLVRAHKRRFQERLIAVAAEAGAEDPYALGNQLLVVFEGATALATTLNDTAALLHARTAAARLIDDATVGARA
ncbi:TetR/AcrR family transcriptional regulator [Mycolicibacterium vaccae]|uniref:TetR family transcriptional regulator n=1 Tax=Mycolicibacterium vaccae ATCC 25954 TaxID=1194972 RepID=K0V4Q1_MYCVA|nr:TetR/AcrR family transcriptional regulator [Mycolicibacterium vaccae]ANI38299.1 TetR family transcriptional regulator [Mycolicibacterium vaccae 95051]EJZ06064.1 TetR family transcriptional regulator [Mycolicibacterium vaccae ATCC 25954]MCV7061287.1 TetR/AcrR family transcriptional regulator [Mycolicibacterium vaccae]